MSENQNRKTGEEQQAKQEAAEHVVERVESWHEGAEPQTLREELTEGMDEAGVQAPDAELDRAAEEIHEEGGTETPDVR